MPPRGSGRIGSFAPPYQDFCRFHRVRFAHGADPSRHLVRRCHRMDYISVTDSKGWGDSEAKPSGHVSYGYMGYFAECGESMSDSDESSSTDQKQSPTPRPDPTKS